MCETGFRGNPGTQPPEAFPLILRRLLGTSSQDNWASVGNKWDLGKFPGHLSREHCSCGSPDGGHAAERGAVRASVSGVPSRLGMGLCASADTALREPVPRVRSPAPTWHPRSAGPSTGWSLVGAALVSSLGGRRLDPLPWAPAGGDSQVGSGFFGEGSKREHEMSDPEDIHLEIPGPGGAGTVTALIKRFNCESIV